MSDIYLQSLECFCVKGVTTTCPGGGELDATLHVEAATSASVNGTGSVLNQSSRARCTDADIVASSSLSAKLSAEYGLAE